MSDEARKKRAGKAGARKPTGKKSAKKGAKSSKDAKPSFLKRLLKRDGDDKKANKSGATNAEKKKPLTPLEKSIAEIRQLQGVGERDPERLAGLLANILAKEKAKQDEAREKFDAMVWDIVHGEEQGDEDGGTGAEGESSDAGQTDSTDGTGPEPTHN